MRPSSRAGVTLMELLIAVSLLSLLVAGILTAMRVGLNALERTNQRVIANRRAMGAQKILEQQFAGFMPVSADCSAAGGQPPYTRIPFFEGETQSMRFVSSYSLAEASRGAPSILEFQVIPGQENRGYRLVVNEVPYTGPLGAGRFCLGIANDPVLGGPVPQFVPITIGANSFVLADKLSSVRFLYREIMPPPLNERWVPRWILPYWPSAIRMEMQPIEPDPSKINPTTLTIPIFVNRVPMGQYVD
jgi:prepilin-type N-terminal cleavage/methylation domain-containing protein